MIFFKCECRKQNAEDRFHTLCHNYNKNKGQDNKDKDKDKNKFISIIFLILICCIEPPTIVEDGNLISLSPSITETLIALGLNESICGIDMASRTILKEDMGGVEIVYSYSDIYLEKVMELNPEIVFIDPDLNPDLGQKLKNRGLKVIPIKAENIDEVMDNIFLIGEITNSSERAIALVDEMNDRMYRIEPIEDKPGVLLLSWFKSQSPLAGGEIFTCGSSTIGSDVIRLAGGENLVDERKGYSTISLEEIIKLDPEVIIVPVDVNYPDRTYENLISEQRLSSVQAIRDNRIYMIDASIISRPSYIAIEGVEELNRIFVEDAIRI